MGCITGIGRFILVVLNLVILLISLAVLAMGIILKFFANIISEYILGAMPAGDPTRSTTFNIPDLKDVTEMPFVGDLGLALIIFGVILALVSFFACCGACYKCRILLILFAITMTILLIGQAVVGGLFLAKDSILHDNLKSTVGDKVKSDFKSDGSDIFSTSINLLHYQLKCCGIRDKNDFKNSVRPPSCCKREIIDGGTAKSAEQQACSATPPTAPDSYYNPQGCYDTLQDHVLVNLTIAGVILGCILFAQLLEIIFACLIAKEVSDENNKIGPI